MQLKNLQGKLFFVLSIPIFLLSVIFFCYSYFWIYHGLVTFLAADKPFIGNLFNLINFTSDHKVLMAQYYLLIIICLFIIQLFFLLPNINKKNWSRSFLIFLGLITILYSLSNAFLSKDIFYYYISAKMAYVYHMNPFNNAPIELLDRDFFVNVSHNIKSPYLYGPLFLAYSIIPLVIFSAQKVIFYFLTLKILNGLLFFICGLLIYRLTNQDKRIFSIWFLNPFLLIEWLSNTHNDIVMISLFIASYYFFRNSNLLKSLFFLTLSVLIKYVSLLSIPSLFLRENLRTHYFKILGLTLPLLIHLTGVTIQPWYLGWSYMFLPLAKLKTLTWIIFFTIGFISLINYYRFLESSGWGAGLIIPHPFLLTNILLASALIIEYWPYLSIYLPFQGRIIRK